MDINNYPGAKRNSGIIQFLLNEVPAHRFYVEGFAGSAQLYFAKKPAEQSYLIDRDEDTMSQLSRLIDEKGHDLTYLFIDDYLIRSVCIPNNEETFIYLDPPYPLTSRRNGRKYYKYEMTDQDHVLLLDDCCISAAKIMISTMDNHIYEEVLKGWRKKEFQTTGHFGPYKEIIYMNYPEPEFLHDYSFVGNDHTDRQRIKRKVSRFEKRMLSLNEKERHLLIKSLIKNHREEILTFLTEEKPKTAT